MIDEWARYRWAKSNRVALLNKRVKLVSGNSKKGWILLRVKDPDWFRHSNGESPKSVGRRAKLAVGARKFATHKRHMVLYKK